MSQFYDQASLVVVPSGYKAGTVYAQKPLTTDGQLTFTRTGDTATRVNSAGIIEKVRTNLYPRGSALLATGWTSVGATLTAGQTDPDGGTTALRVQLAAAQSPYAYIFQSLSGSAATYARSAYIKAASAQSIRIVDPHSGAGTTVNLTTDWQRFTAVGAGSGGNFGIQFDNDNDDAAKDFTIAFVQIETGDIATAYIPTTTAAVSVGPTANTARLDYLGSTCPRLLLEPQRTNLLQFSEQIDNAYWTKQDASITANTVVSPDGYKNADSLVENSATASHQAMRTGITITTATAYTASVYFKANTRTRAAIQLAGAAFFDTANGVVIFNLSTGAIVSQTGNATGTITAMGNGWYRCTATKTSVGTNGVVSFNMVDSSNNLSYAGNNTNSIYMWGCQLEQGAYSTSLIPTLAASATRGADACSKTGISSLIGQTEGTLFVDFTINELANFGTPISVNDGSTSNYIWLTIFSNGNLRAELNNGTVQAAITYGGAVVGGRYKMAFGYKTNDFALYVNGTQVGTDNSGTTFSGTTLSRVDTDITNASVYSTASESINQALLFKTRLTNAELAELTTL
jgi:hypothetical protein